MVDFQDPATTKCRIFVKNTPRSSNVDKLKADLAEHFSKYGKVLGVMSQPGFSFIQFETEEAAACASQMENNTSFQGSMLKVTPARPPPGPESRKQTPKGDFNNRDRQSQNADFGNRGGPAQGGDFNNRGGPPGPQGNDFNNGGGPPQENDFNNRGGPPQGGDFNNRGGPPQGNNFNNRDRQPQNTDFNNRGGPPKGGDLNNRGPPRGGPSQNADFNRDQPPQGGDFRDRSPIRGRSPPMRGRSPPMRGRSPPKRGRSPVRGRSPPRGRSPIRDDWRPRFHDDYGDSYNSFYPPARFPPVMERVEPIPAPIVKPPNPAERTNDVEILVFDRLNTLFGESIEKKLKNLGLSADILFPNAIIPIGKLLGNIAKRGTLYAISVMPVNEIKESFTVNILQGDSEEHRNIPFDQGINLITINFDKYIQSGGQRTAPAVVPQVGSSGSSMHPEAIQTMINLLLQKRPLTLMQYDALIKYIDQLKDKQTKLELGDALMPTMEAPPSGGAEDLLKSRIMSIMDQTLNKGVPAVAATTPLPQAVQPKPDLSSAKPMLQNPNIQNALNTLLSGGAFNFLK